MYLLILLKEIELQNERDINELEEILKQKESQSVKISTLEKRLLDLEDEVTFESNKILMNID